MEIRSFVSLLLFSIVVNGQQTSYELPVQLVGFPFIAGSVRLTNFLKKLSYSLSPATYRSRARRELTFASGVPEPFDAQEVEKYVIGEFGARACVFERVCAHYATRARAQPKPQMDWSQIFRNVLFYARPFVINPASTSGTDINRGELVLYKTTETFTVHSVNVNINGPLTRLRSSTCSVCSLETSWVHHNFVTNWGRGEGVMKIYLEKLIFR